MSNATSESSVGALPTCERLTEDLFSSRIYFISSLLIIGLSCIKTTRSRVFSSSLTFPGQSYWMRVCIASYDKQFTEILCFFFKLFKIDIAVGMTSSFLSLSGGTVIGKTFIRWKRSWRKEPSLILVSRSWLVADMILTSTRIVSAPPTLSISPLSRTLSIFACKEGLMSPISSRNMLPEFAAKNFPSFLSTAPVKAPFSCPKSSLSSKSDGIAGQLTAMLGLSLLRLIKCRVRAIRFFPVPDSP